MPLQAQPVEMDEARELLRSAGLRCTAARLAVLQHLRQVQAPVSHAEVAEKLVPLGFDKATVFRNLIDLAEARLASRTELGDHVWRFELREPNDPDHAQHSHFLCVECGRVTCLTEMEFDDAAHRQTAKIGRVTEVLLKGYCNRCQ